MATEPKTFFLVYRTMLQPTEPYQPGWKALLFRKAAVSPGGVAQLVRALSRYAKVVGSISGQGTYKQQPMNAKVSGTTKLMLLSIPHPLFLSNQ